MAIARMRKLIAGLLLTTFSGLSAQASSIDLLLSADPSTPALGDTIIVDISLNIADTAEIDGVALELIWDDSLTGIRFDEAFANVFADTNIFADPDVMPSVIAPPFLTDMRLIFDFSSPLAIFPGQEPTFFDTGISLIGQLILEVTGAIPADGASIIATGTAVNSDLASLEFSATTTITSVVPLPAAAWFFGTSLIGLLAVRRRKLHSPATV